MNDACSLVDAFRAKELSPLEALDACIEAIERSPLNAFSHTDFDRAREAATFADVTLPFGGVPFGVKELEKVEGWPYTEASVFFKDRIADEDDTSVARLRTTGAVLAAQTTRPSSAASTAPRPSCTARRATRGTSSARRAAPPAVPRPRWRVACCPSPRGATAAVRSVVRPPSAGCSG